MTNKRKLNTKNRKNDTKTITRETNEENAKLQIINGNGAEKRNGEGNGERW